MHQLLDHLRDAGSSARVVYPLEALVSHREHAYPKTGSHWTGFGAYVAAETLLDDIRVDVAPRSPAADAFGFVEITFIGDLGAKLTPPATSPFVRAEPLAPRARLVSDNRVRNTGRRVVYESGAEDAPECLVYGDSFAMRVSRSWPRASARLTFVHMVDLDLELVAELQPDVVVKIMNERFLIAVPVDDARQVAGRAGGGAARRRRGAAAATQPPRRGATVATAVARRR